MKNEMELSKESKEFLENLSVYLFSTGRNSEEIDNIVVELETHLQEAEKKGKSIEKIIGQSPKEYMKMISDEMAIDYQTWFKYICIIILGSFSFTVFSDLLEGNLSYSILEILGDILIGALFLFSLLKGFKYISTANLSLKKQGLVIAGIAFLPISLYFGLIYLNRAIETPIIYFNNTGSIIIGIIMALFILGVSVWAKTWILIVIISLLILPEFLLNFTPMQYETQLVVSTLISFGGIIAYLWILSKLEKDN